jgi:uncharacterized membrane protein YcjF (UPF0283 family)
VIEYLLTLTEGIPNVTTAAIAAASAGTLIVGATVLSVRRQKRALARLDERITHLTAGVSLLANTTEDGLRGIAAEIARLAGTAEQKPQAHGGVRQRIAAAAGHGRSVQDIAATEQVSEGEVLLHLLLDKLTPDPQGAEVC